MARGGAFAALGGGVGQQGAASPFDLVATTRPAFDPAPEDYEDTWPIPTQGGRPWDMGQIEWNRSTGGLSRGTGNVIGPVHVLTVAHNTFDQEVGCAAFAESGDPCSDPISVVEFTPGKQPGSNVAPIDVIAIGYDLRWLDAYNNATIPRYADVAAFDLSVLFLADNETTANSAWQSFYGGIPEGAYEGRAIGVYGYPNPEAGPGFEASRLHMSFGGFRGFAGQDLAEYGALTVAGISGGKVAAYPNGLAGDEGMYLLSFLHQGRAEGDADRPRVGVRFSREKAGYVVDAVCKLPGGLIDLSEDCG